MDSTSAALFFLHVLCLFFGLVFSKDTCPVVGYTGSFKESDHVKDHAVIGRSYRNLTTNTVQECFSVCINDCRCMSYQLSARRCELIDENRHTAPDRFQAMPGYKYYELKQELKKSSLTSHDCSSQCINGCCRYFPPCLNGGTCIELCQNVTHKFQCKCPQGFGGRVCEIPPSCAGYSTRSVPSVYPIEISNGNVYYMTSEPGMKWTLIESFALSEKSKYRKKPLTMDFSSNEASFNWKDYRLSSSVMQYIRRNATHWRATCNYNTDGLVKIDYVLGLLSDLDILTYSGGHKCFRVQYLNIRGYTCKNCTSHFRQDEVHILIDSHRGVKENCFYNGEQGCPSGGCDYFGKYQDEQINPQFRCSCSENSTTQWWLGTAIDPGQLQGQTESNGVGNRN